jgi:hypothetical protein
VLLTYARNLPQVNNSNMNTTNMKVLAVALLAACLLCLIPVSLGTDKVTVDGKVLSSSSIPALSAIAVVAAVLGHLL